MKLMYSIFFGAAAAALAYSRLGRRVGYGNAANVWTIVGVVFVIFTILFYVSFASLIPDN
jgi:hypothetical protein